MIRQLRGRLLRRAPTSAVVDVGGIGYGLAISLATFDRLPADGEETALFTYTHVREDRLELFGFAHEEERDMFELLIGVAGIGPTSALTVLSGLSVQDLREAIFNESVPDLTQVRGIGRKIAERIVVELKDKIRSSTLSGAAQAASDGGSLPASAMEEATLALIALGIAAPAARKAVVSAAKKRGDEATVQELIKQALLE